MRHSLGRPLPHQQADTPRADPGPPELCPAMHAHYWGYPVLATVSRGCPEVQGPLPTCYSPVRRFQPELLRVLVSSLDLHVLSTPPAFVLSQDQTLRREFVSCSWKNTNELMFILRLAGFILGTSVSWLHGASSASPLDEVDRIFRSPAGLRST